MNKLLNFFDKTVSYAAVFALFIMVALVFFNVLLRYIFNSGLPWSEEISRLCFVWVVFLGIVLAARDRAHLVVDIISSFVPAKVLTVLSYIVKLITITIMLTILIGGTKLMILTYSQKLPASGLSTAYLYLAGIFGAICIIVITFASFFTSTKEGEK